MRPRRSGITMTEVLVAIFVCGLGLMALMTLFPLGAMNMAQAIKDDRCGHAAANASAILRTFWRVSLESGGPSTDPQLLALENDLLRGPVYLDPLGVNMYGPGSVGGIPRRNLANCSFQQAIRWCSLLDDIDFNPNGTPVNLGSEISRQGRYSWAWMVRWPPGKDQIPPPNQPPAARARVLEYSVVVYHNRPQVLGVSALTASETAYGGVTFDPVNRMAVVPYNAGGRPAIRKMGWILDVTPDAVTGQPHGYFYRVESVRDTGGALVITVQNPFRGAFAGAGTIVAMDTVAEVFERSTLE